VTKRKAKKEKPYSTRISATLAGTYIFLVIGAISLLAFLSPHIAFLASGLSGICLILYFDQRWRGFWEQGMSFQISSLKKEHQMLVTQVADSVQDLERLKKSVSELTTRDAPIAINAKAATAATAKIKTVIDIEAEAEADIIQLPVSALVKGSGNGSDKRALKKKLHGIKAKTGMKKKTRLVNSSHSSAMSTVSTVAPQKKKAQKSVSYHELTQNPVAANAADQTEAMQSPFRSTSRALSPATKPPSTYFHSPAGEEPQYTDTVIRNLVRSAVQNRDIAMFVQPVMAMPQRKVRFYELFARVRAGAGNYIPAAQFMGLAQADQLDQDIDNLLLIECLKVVQASAHIPRVAPFFVNITGATLGNAAFMQRLIGFIGKNRDLAARLIFDIPYADYKALNSDLLKVLRGLGQLGCRFAIGNAQDMEFDVTELMARKVRYIKMDKAVLLKQIKSDRGLSQALQAKRKFEGNGVGIVGEKIESEADVRSLMDLDLNFAQGYLFGRPDLQAAYTGNAKAKAA